MLRWCWFENFRSAPAVLAALLALSSLCAIASGCSRSADSDKHNDAHSHESDHEHDAAEAALPGPPVDMPRDYADAVKRLREYQKTIVDAVGSGKPHDAHHPLDELDIVLGKLMWIARDSGVARGDWEEVNLARRELRAQFDLVHAAIDNDQQPDLAAARQGTDAALTRLEMIAARHEPTPSAAEKATDPNAPEVEQ